MTDHDELMVWEEVTPARDGGLQILELVPKAMAQIKAVAKLGWNASQQYSYRQVDDLYDAIGPALAAIGITPETQVLGCFQQSEYKTRSGATGVRLILWVRIRLYAPDGSHIAHVTLGEGMDTGDKSVNKAITSAVKNAVVPGFMIPVGGTDSEADSPENDRPKGKGKKARGKPARGEGDARPKSTRAEGDPRPTQQTLAIVAACKEAETLERIDQLVADAKKLPRERDRTWALAHLTKRAEALEEATDGQ